MELRKKSICMTVLLLCTLIGSATVAMAQGRSPRRPDIDQAQDGTRPKHDALGFLKHALTEANAPALTSQEETDLNTLVTNFHQSQPHGPDQTLQAAHTAYNNAILAGDLATAQAQATVIANHTAALGNTRLQAEAKFDADVLTILKNGGQFDPLKQKLGDHVLGVINSLVGGPPFGGPGFGPGGGPGFAPMGGPGRRGGGPGGGNTIKQ